MEGADEIGEIAEADVIGDIGDRAVVVGQPPRRMAQPRAHQILVRGDAEHAREQPQEMERADAGLRGGILQVDRSDANWHRSTAPFPPRGGGRGRRPAPALRGLPGDHLDKAAGQHLADLVEADVAAAICRRLRQLAQHHQFRQRRRGADLPEPSRLRRRSPRPVPALRKNDRHSSPQTWSWVQVYSSPGWPTSTDPATSSWERPRQWQPKLPLRT